MAPSKTSSDFTDLSEKTSQISLENVSVLWELKEIPGKGRGLVTTQDIAPGTLLISEAPVLTTDVVTSFDMDVTEQDLLTALKKLPSESQESFRSLHNNYALEDPKHPLSGIVRSNAYPLGAGAEVGGVFPDISRINHSCLPNTVQYWNPLLEKQTIYAVRKITSGDEITTSYHEGGPSTERKKILKEHFGFECTCEICSLPTEALSESDERLAKAQTLDSTIGDAKKIHFEPEEVMKCCRTLFQIYEKEGVKDGRLSRLYWDLFQMCNMHGDLARARCFAKYYCDSKKIAEGPDSVNVLEAKPYVKSPGKHGSCEPKGKWKTGVTDVPKGLGAKEFAKWLWRENI
jgi:hypothetical protein